jgi:hypothetical protein
MCPLRPRMGTPRFRNCACAYNGIGGKPFRLESLYFTATGPNLATLTHLFSGQPHLKWLRCLCDSAPSRLCVERSFFRYGRRFPPGAAGHSLRDEFYAGQLPHHEFLVNSFDPSQILA